MAVHLPRLFVVVLLLVGSAVLNSAPQTPVPPPPVQGPVRVGGDIREPRKLVTVAPVYPPEAKAAGVQGVIILEAIITTEGKVRDVRVLRGQPMLTDPAIAAVSQWEYTPTVFNGTPVEVIMTVTVNFSLGNGGSAVAPLPGVPGAPAVPRPPPVDLTGEWLGDDGGRYQLRSVANELFWIGAHSAQGWAHVFHGARAPSGEYVGRWAEVPPGRLNESGTLTVRVLSADAIEIVGIPPNFSGRRLQRASVAAGRTLIN